MTLKLNNDELNNNLSQLEIEENLLIATEILCFLQVVATSILKDEEFIPMIKDIVEKDEVSGRLFLNNLNICVSNLKNILKGEKNERPN